MCVHAGRGALCQWGRADVLVTERCIIMKGVPVANARWEVVTMADGHMLQCSFSVDTADVQRRCANVCHRYE